MRKLSLLRAFKNDYSLVLSVILFFVPGGVSVGGLILGWLPKSNGIGRTPVTAADSSFVVTMAAVFAALGAILFAYRLRVLTSLFKSGIETSGLVVEIYRYRDRGRVEFTYQHQGIEYRSGIAIHKSADTESLEKGSQVPLLIDPNRPTKAIISSLYAESS